jgi:hypothetical protein
MDGLSKWSCSRLNDAADIFESRYPELRPHLSRSGVDAKPQNRHGGFGQNQPFNWEIVNDRVWPGT